MASQFHNQSCNSHVIFLLQVSFVRQCMRSNLFESNFRVNCMSMFFSSQASICGIHAINSHCIFNKSRNKCIQIDGTTCTYVYSHMQTCINNGLKTTTIHLHCAEFPIFFEIGVLYQLMLWYHMYLYISICNAFTYIYTYVCIYTVCMSCFGL